MGKIKHRIFLTRGEAFRPRRMTLGGEDAMRHALEHLKKAIVNVARLPDPSMEHEVQMLTDALIDMRISKAMMTVAVAASTISVPI